MSDTMDSDSQKQRQLSFLQSTLSMNPSEQVLDILNARRSFARPDGLVEAQLVEVDQGLAAAACANGGQFVS